MTRTDTDPHADEQDPARCIAWDDPSAESDSDCPHCADQLDEYDRRRHECAVAEAWDQAHAEDAARQRRPHD